jgi:hypothetical protein
MEEAIKKDALRNPSEFISTNFNYNIDNKGTIIYNFKEIEGTIKDTGKQLYFTFNDERCREIAKQYANLKWGKVEVTDNLIVPSRSQTKQSQNYFSR